jgi:hypothetical protein
VLLLRFALQIEQSVTLFFTRTLDTGWGPGKGGGYGKGKGGPGGRGLGGRGLCGEDDGDGAGSGDGGGERMIMEELKVTKEEASKLLKEFGSVRKAVDSKKKS